MMKKLGEMQLCTAYCLKSIIIKQLSHYVIPFGFRKGKSEEKKLPFQSYICFLINLLNTSDRKTQFTVIVDRGWR